MIWLAKPRPDVRTHAGAGNWARSGWEAQQAAKLLSACIATSEYLVIFDSKNAIQMDLAPHTFVSADGQAILNGATKLYEHNSDTHRNWAIISARIFGAAYRNDEYICDSVKPCTPLQLNASNACVSAHQHVHQHTLEQGRGENLQPRTLPRTVAMRRSRLLCSIGRRCLQCSRSCAPSMAAARRPALLRGPRSPARVEELPLTTGRRGFRRRSRSRPRLALEPSSSCSVSACACACACACAVEFMLCERLK